MKILLDATGSCRPAFQTGIQRVVRNLFRELEAKAEVKAIFWSSRSASYRLMDDKRQRYLRDPFAPSPTTQTQRIFRKVIDFFGLPQERALNPIYLTEARCDVFLEPEIYSDERFIYLCNSAKRMKCPKVALFYDAITWLHPEWSSSDRQKQFGEYLRSLVHFSKVICISEQSSADLKKFWSDHNISGRAEILVEPLPANGIPVLSKSLKPPIRPQILCVGTLEPRKNHMTLLAAMEKLWEKGRPFDHVKLVLIGRSVSWAKPNPVQAIKTLQQKGHPIEWLGTVDEARLAERYHACHFTVFPSLMEGYGLPIVESLLYGKPVICGADGAIGELSKGGGCLTTNCSDPTTLAEAIQRLLQDNNLHTDLAQQACSRSFRTWEDYSSAIFSHLG